MRPFKKYEWNLTRKLPRMDKKTLIPLRFRYVASALLILVILCGFLLIHIETSFCFIPGPLLRIDLELSNTVTKEYMYEIREHVEYLSSLGTRATGTRGNFL